VATLTLKDQLAGEVSEARLFYTDLPNDNTSAVLQDAAGNDLASLSFNGTAGRAVGAMGSTVVAATAFGTEVRVFNNGKVGGTDNDDLAYRGTGEEFLTGGVGRYLSRCRARCRGGSESSDLERLDVVERFLRFAAIATRHADALRQQLHQHCGIRRFDVLRQCDRFIPRQLDGDHLILPFWGYAATKCGHGFEYS
jgi:hypothetical protein